MDSGDYIPDKPDSAGAHSVRSQLIVVSPRPSLEEEEEGERAASAGAGAGESQRSSSSQEPEHFIFTNPVANMENEGESINTTRSSGSGNVARKMQRVACLRSQVFTTF